MPIGTQTPGSQTTVTPDSTPSTYTSVQGPAPDGLVVADDVLACHQEILNVQERLRACVPGRASYTTIHVPVNSCITPSAWLVNYSSDLRPIVFQSSAGTQWIMFPISHLLPQSGKISAITAHIKPSTGHGGSLPGGVPRVELRRVPIGDYAAMTTLDSFEDESNIATYETAHGFGGAIGPYAIDQSYAYFILLQGENGSGALANLILYALLFTVTP